jgi:hypothetical protein
MIVPGFKDVAVPHFFQAGHSKTSAAPLGVDVHGDRATARRADHHVGVVLVERGLRDPDRFGEIFIRQGGIDHGMAVFRQIGWFHATRL